MKKPYYITTSIMYASKMPHIGNVYEAIMADAVARYKRACGYDVYFLTGTDEHGQKVEDCAKAAGVSPKEYVNRVSGGIQTLWDRMGITYNRFIRTTDPDHEAAVRKIFNKFYEQDDLYLSEYEGWYCEPDEAFYTESQVCKTPDNGVVCPDCGKPLQRVKEQSYFFRIGKYADRLIKHIEENPDFIVPESRKKEMVNNFLKPGLKDLCVTRTSFQWGVGVDFDPKHVVYVWVDALSNYITGLGYNPDNQNGELYKKYWPADVHIIGKDIVRFHTLYWPIFLLALGLPLPKQVYGHPWLLTGGDKMSKSTGNVIFADDVADLFGVDAARYYVLSEMPYANDGNVTWENIAARYNSDLANTLGNLVSRTVAMTGKYFDGVIPSAANEEGPDADLKAVAAKAVAEYRKLMDEMRIADAAFAVMELARRSNKYIDETTPWALAKNEADKARLGTVLYNLLECIRIIAVLYAPLIPEASKNIMEQLGGCADTLESVETFGGLKAGVLTKPAAPLFARFDEKTLGERVAEKTGVAAEKVGSATEKAEPEKPQVTIDEFSKVEMTVCKVLACEKVEKSDKLLQFKLDDGSGTPRQILSGIAKYYQPEQLVGKTVVACTNLPPRKMMGTQSNGMLLSAEKDGKLNLLMLDDGIPAGAKLC